MATRVSFPKVCIALGLPNADELMTQARHEIEQGERFLEFRLDHLNEPCSGAAVIQKLTKEFPDTAILATCRRKDNHGGFAGSIEAQLRVLGVAVEAGARAIDLEIESAEIRGVPLEPLRRVNFVVSYHNWESTPALDAVVKRMTKIDADVYKLVTTARKPSDIVRVLSALKPAARSKWVSTLR